MIKLPYPFYPSIFPLVPEPEPVFPEDVEKLNAIIKELEAENSELRTKLNRVTLENESQNDDQQNKDKKLEASNKRAKESNERREKFGHALKGTKYVFKTKNQELDQVALKIQELNKTVERTLEMKRETRLISEIRTHELENTIQRCKDTFAHEQLWIEESGRACIRLNYQLEQSNRRIRAHESMDHDVA